MTKVAKVGLLVLVGSSMLVAGANQMKMYDIKSGKIEYEIKGGGEIMGSKMQTFGKKRVIFDDNGAKNLTEENKIDKQDVMGQKKVTKTHTMTYMKSNMIYHVNFEKRRIMRMGNMGAGMAMLMGGGQNMKQTGEEMMKKMGGKKTGTDKVLGYTCDIWDLMGTKQCIYKGIPLRVESNMMGIKNTEIATKAEFDLSLSSDDFKLPDFSVYDMEGNKLDRSKLDTMDTKAKTDMAKDMDEMALKKEAFAKAKRDAGIKEGERGTQAQQKQMQESMMEAMLPRMKQEVMADEKMMRFGYECLSKADTLKEANVCNDKANAMGGEPEEPFDDWSPATKKEVLGFLDQYLNIMLPCVKKAQTMKAARQCMPQE